MKIHQHLIGTLALLAVLLASALTITPAYAATGATFVISGTDLNLDLMTGVSATINTSSGTYTFVLNGANTWLGTDGSGVTGNGTGTLSVLASGAYTAINITDSGTGVSVTFSNSGGLTYTKSFNVSLDNGPGTVTINGTTNIPSSGSTFSVTAPTINMNGSVTTFDGAQTYNGPITLGANALPTGIIGGDITFNGTINGAYALTVITSGMTTFKDSIGNTTHLTGLTTDASGTTRIDLNTGGARVINTDGPQTFNDPVTIINAAIVHAFTVGPGLGNLTFASTLDNGNVIFTADNFLTFDGAVGATTPMLGLQIPSSASNKVLINTDTIRVSGLLNILTNTVFDSPTDAILIQATASNGTIVLGTDNTQFLRGATDGQESLTVNVTGASGSIDIRAVVGDNGKRLKDLTVSSASATIPSILRSSSITTSETQTYNVPILTLNATTTLTGSEIDFTGGVGSVSGTNPLTLAPASSSANITVGEAADTGAAVLDITDTDIAALADGLSSITIGDAASGSGALTVVSSSFSDPLTIVGGSISVTGLSDSTGPVSLTARTGAITDGGTATADVTATSLALSSVSGVGTSGDFLDTSVSNVEAQTDTVGIFVSNTGDLIVGGVSGSLTGATTTSNNGIRFTSTSGTLTIDEPLSAAGVGDLVLTADTDMTINAAMSAGGGDVILTSTNNGDITLNATVNGAFDLDANTGGATIFNNAVGNTTPLTSLQVGSTGSTAINGGLVRTTGAQSYLNAINLNASANATILESTAAGNITLGQNNTTALISVTSGEESLTVTTSGSTNVNNWVGTGGFLLNTLTIDGGGVTNLNGGVIRSAGAQTYGDAVILGINNAILTSTGGADIVFNDTIDGAFGLATNTTGTIQFNGAIGGTIALTSLATDGGAGTIAVNGGLVRTTGTQSYQKNMLLNAAANLTTLQSIGGSNILLGQNSTNSIRSLTDGEESLTVTTSGTGTNIKTVIGSGGQRLNNLTVNGGGATGLNGGSVTTTGAQTYASTTTVLGGIATTLTGSEIDFNGGVGSVTGTSSLNLAPADPGANISIGQAADTGAAILDITDADIAALANGFSALTIGDAAAGSGAVDADSAAFLDPVTIVGGSVSVTELNDSGNAVMITARTGSISDGGSAGADVTASTLTISAVSGIGAGNSLNTVVTNLEAQTDSGGVFVSNTGALTIGGASGSLTGIETTTSGSIDLSTSSSLTINEALSGAGDITLTSVSIAITASLQSSENLVIQPVSASSTIGIGGGTGTLNISDAELALLADGFNTILIGDPVSGSGAADVDSSTFNDPISISGGSLSVTQLNAGSNPVVLTARVGNLTDGGDVGTDVTGGTVTLNASGLIGGSGNELSLAATTLATTSSGNQFIRESDSLTWNTSTSGSMGFNLLGGQFNVGSGQTITTGGVSVGNGVTLGGVGTVNGLVAGQSGGTIAPGNSPGILQSGNASFAAGSDLEIEANGVTTAGTDYDQLNVTGMVTIDSAATLTLSGTVSGATTGSVLTIINNDGVDPVSGAFNGLPDGAAVTINSDHFNISYSGGDGNDVVLVADNTAPVITINEPNTSPAISKTITASAPDGTLTMSNTTGAVCDGTLTFVAYSDQTFTSDADNGVKVCYRAVDTAGNTAYSLSNAIAGIDTTAPVITINEPNTSPAISKTITASAPDGTLTMSNTIGAVCDGSLTFVAYADQTFTSEADNGVKVCYRAADALGNTGYSLSNAIAGIDMTGPTVSIEQSSGQSDPTNASPIVFDVTFSESVTGFDSNDVNISGMVAAPGITVLGSGAAYTVEVTGMTDGETVSASIPTGAAQDAVSNDSEASTSSDNSVTYDTNAPVITINEPNTSPALSKTITASASDGTLTMSNNTGSTCNGSLSFIAYSSQTFTSESDNGVKVCYKALDAAGNSAYSLSNAIAGITLATSTPTVTHTATPTPTNSTTATPTVTVTYTASQTPTKTPTKTLTPTKTVTPTKTPVTVEFSSIAAQDGFVLESAENSNVGGTLNNTSAALVLGDDLGRRQYRSILSFGTGTIPDGATLISVKLKVKKAAIIGGGDPLSIFNGFMIDMKNGYFDTLGALQITDFQALADGTYGPGTPALIDNVYTINLTNGKAHINKLAVNGGLTQIRLRFTLDDNNDALANYLSLFSGDTAMPESYPHLVITYYAP